MKQRNNPITQTANRLSDHMTDTGIPTKFQSPEDFSSALPVSDLDSANPDSLREELENLRHIKQQLMHNADRMESKLKEQLRKKRTSRLIHWGAELEHQLHLHAPDQKSTIEQITQDQQKNIMKRLFDDDDIQRKILQALSDIL